MMFLLRSRVHLMSPAVALAIVFAKLSYIRASEIVAIPYDATLYIGYARFGYWTDHAIWKGMYPPGYPLLLEFVSWSGIPLRLFQEGGYLGAAYYLAYAVARPSRSWTLRLVLFAALAFAPETAFFFAYVQTENLVLVLTLLSVASTLLLLRQTTNIGRMLHGLIIAVSWAWIVISRTEMIVFAGVLAAFAGLLVLAFFLPRANRLLFPAARLGRSQLAATILGLIVLPACLAVGATTTVSDENKAKLGITGQSVLSGQAMLRLYDAMLRIDADSGLLYLPIDAHTRALAYAASPTLATIATAFEAEGRPYESRGGRNARAAANIPKAEIETAYFLWVVTQSIGKVYPNDDLPQQEQFLDRAAGELEQALADGRLPRRHVWFAAVDPRIGLWLPHLPSAFSIVGAELFTAPWGEVPLTRCDAPGTDSAAWDFVANRRTAMICASGKTDSAQKADRDPGGLDRGYRIKRWLLRLAILAAISLPVMMFMSRHRPDRLAMLRDHLPTLAVLAIYIVVRTAFYGLLEACMWLVPSRYLFPVMPLVTIAEIVLIVVALQLGLSLAVERWRQAHVNSTIT